MKYLVILSLAVSAWAVSFGLGWLVLGSALAGLAWAILVAFAGIMYFLLATR